MLQLSSIQTPFLRTSKKKGPIISKLIIPTRFNDLEINLFIDTGSQVTILQKNIFDKLKVEKLQPLNSTLGGFGRCRLKPLGYFKSNIEIDEIKCIANAYVVHDKVMSSQAIIGLNVLMQGETTINEIGITV